MRKKVCAILTAVALAFSLVSVAHAAPEVLCVNGENLWREAKAEIVNGTAYVSLRAAARLLSPEAQVSWREKTAFVEGEGLILTARPGDKFLSVNDRVLYVSHGVRLENGTVMVPLRVLATALGGQVHWSRQEGITLVAGDGIPDAAAYSADDLYWMARIISAESRGEPLEGKLAVGTVVLNRVASSQFPDSIYDVIFDREWGIQFQPVANGTIYSEPTNESILAAKMVLEGARVAGKSLYFLAPTLTNNHWIMENREYVTTIGAHWFYR